MEQDWVTTHDVMRSRRSGTGVDNLQQICRADPGLVKHRFFLYKKIGF